MGVRKHCYIASIVSNIILVNDTLNTSLTENEWTLRNH